MLMQHPAFRGYGTRLQSFDQAPARLKAKAPQLAKAGFFFVDHPDKTICFCCGGGLWLWGEDDDPWREHVAHFSKCMYVTHHKGRRYVREVLEELNKKKPAPTSSNMS